MSDKREELQRVMRTFRVVIPVYLRAEEIHEIEAGTAAEARELALDAEPSSVIEDSYFYEVQKDNVTVERIMGTPMVEQYGRQGEAVDLDSDIDLVFRSSALTGEKQNALARILGDLLTRPQSGRPFVMSPGEMRRAIRLAEQEADLPKGEGVLDYSHPLLPDPVVSCASRDQLMANLAHRFGDPLRSALESISELAQGDWSDKYRDESMASDMAAIADAALVDCEVALAQTDCDESCAVHADGCDGCCDHDSTNHTNGCMTNKA